MQVQIALKSVIRAVSTTILVSVLLAQGWLAGEVAAQKSTGRQPAEKTSSRFDLIENAAALTMDVGREAAALSNPDGKVETQFEAARILAPVHPADALRLLDKAWLSLKEWGEGGQLSSVQRRRVIDLRGNLLNLYTQLAPERVNKLAATLPDNAVKNAANSEHEGGNNPPLPTARQAADEIINISFPKLKHSPAEVVEAAILSLQQTGKISEYLSSVVEVLHEQGNEPLLRVLENRLAAFLSGRSSLDPDDQRAVMFLLNADPQMPSSIQSSFLGFLIRSLHKLVEIIKEARISRQPPPVDADTINYIRGIYARNVRPLFVKYSPQQLERFDFLLSEITASLPPSYLEGIYESSTTDSVEDQLARARKTADKNLRDARLMSFTFRALAGRLPIATERQVELAAIAVEDIDKAETKARLRDYVGLARVRDVTAAKDFLMAAEQALKISKLEWRAWALMAIASARSEQSLSEALQLYDEALRTLGKCSPSPRKAELAFLAAGLLSQHDYLRAFEALAAAAKYANQANEANSTATAQSANLNKFFPHIGKLSFAPGDEPNSLDEIGFMDGIGRLAVNDWLRADQTGRTIQHLALRLRYQLAMSKGALSKSTGEMKAADTN